MCWGPAVFEAPSTIVKLARVSVEGKGTKWWNGRLLVWEPPEPRGHYVLGIDPGQGRGKDRSVIEVVRIGDAKRPDEQVAEFASDAHGPMELSEVAAAIGRLYGGADGEALAVVECNSAGGGDVCLFDMRSRWGYSNHFVWKTYDKAQGLYTTRLGWWTNVSTRPKLIMRGVYGLVHGDLILHSPFLLREMQHFEGDFALAKQVAIIVQREGSPHDRDHDDRVMAMLLAYWGAHDEEWISGGDRDRNRLTPRRETPQDELKPKKDFQNTAVSAEDMAMSIDDVVMG